MFLFDGRSTTIGFKSSRCSKKWGWATPFAGPCPCPWRERTICRGAAGSEEEAWGEAQREEAYLGFLSVRKFCLISACIKQMPCCDNSDVMLRLQIFRGGGVQAISETMMVCWQLLVAKNETAKVHAQETCRLFTNKPFFCALYPCR